MVTTEAGFPRKRKENLLVFYLRSLLYMFMAALIRVAALLPLAALFVFTPDSPLRWLAVICPVLIVFLVLPLRFSFSQAFSQPEGERRFSFDQALSLSGYGEKLGEGLLHALHIVKWGLPLGAMSVAVVYFYYNTDLITLMRSLSDMGAGVTAVLCAVANFFIGIFGRTQIIPNGGLMEGFYVVCAILGVGVLILLWGVVRNSATRYIWVLADRMEKDPRAEARRRLRGRRWPQLGVAAVNLVLWSPALYVVFTTLKDMLGNVSDALFTFVSTQQLNLPEWTNALLPLLFAFLVCYMPLLPIRRFLTCRFATRPVHGTTAVRQAAQPAAAESMATSSGGPQLMAEPYGAQPGVGYAYTHNALPEEDAYSEPAFEPEVHTEPMPAYRPAYHPAQTATTPEPVPTVDMAQPEPMPEEAGAEEAKTQNASVEPENRNGV
ncbi:MAG: hypothetical protein LLF96_00265 [Eubacteriales bacterium]|nr:hypothetical protein [Eubacteriales bacterium]